MAVPFPHWSAVHSVRNPDLSSEEEKEGPGQVAQPLSVDIF